MQYFQFEIFSLKCFLFTEFNALFRKFVNGKRPFECVSRPRVACFSNVWLLGRNRMNEIGYRLRYSVNGTAR